MMMDHPCEFNTAQLQRLSPARQNTLPPDAFADRDTVLENIVIIASNLGFYKCVANHIHCVFAFFSNVTAATKIA